MSDKIKEIANTFSTFERDKQIAVLQQGCELAVGVWEEYTGIKTIEYTHNDARLVLDTNLPRRSLDEVVRKLGGLPSRRAGAITGEWDGPLSGMDGGSLEFPSNIVAAYKAVYQLFLMVFELNTASKPDDVFLTLLNACPEDEAEQEAWFQSLFEIA